MLLGTPVWPTADPDAMAELIADVANANQKLQDLGAHIQTEQESVNKAIVDVETARDNAATAQHDVDASQSRSRTPTPPSRSRRSASTVSRSPPT